MPNNNEVETRAIVATVQVAFYPDQRPGIGVYSEDHCYEHVSELFSERGAELGILDWRYVDPTTAPKLVPFTNTAEEPYVEGAVFDA